MAEVLQFPPPPPEHPISVTLTGEEWLAIALRLSGRMPKPEALFSAETKLLSQLKNAGAK